MGSVSSIDSNHVEQVRFLFVNEPMPLQRYYMGYNEIISKGRVKYCRFNPAIAAGAPAGASFPKVYLFNGILYTTINEPFAPYILVTFGKRGGDFYCVDMPLSEFLQNKTGHHRMQLDWSIDLTKSYVKFLVPSGGFDVTFPICIIFYMDMYGQ